MRAPWMILAVAVLLVLAGCTAPTGTDGADATPQSTAAESADASEVTPTTTTASDSDARSATPETSTGEPSTTPQSTTPVRTAENAGDSVSPYQSEESGASEGGETDVEATERGDSTTGNTDESAGSEPDESTTGGGTDEGVTDEPATMQAVYGIDENRTMRRVTEMLDVEYFPPHVVVSTARTSGVGERYRSSLSRNPFLSVFGLDAASDGGGTFRVAGFVDARRTVVMNGNLSRTQAETTLAHELVHLVQLTKRWRLSWKGEPLWSLRPAVGRDARMVGRMVSEGTAEYLEYSYRQRYVDSSEGVDDRIEALSSFYREIDGSAQLAWAPYRHGVVYVRERVENTTEIPLLFERPTVTTEQALHNETQATEPPRSLSVRVEPSVVDRRGAQGELFARIALEQSLGRSRAVEAAAGWGNDTLLEVEHGDTGGFVWVTRWDTPGDATEFRRAVEDAVESVRIDGTLYDVSVERPAFETAVIVIGPPAFQQAIDVEATDGAVEIGATANATAEGSAQGR